MNILRIGSKGPDVVTLQKKLAAAGFSPGDIDGKFGGGTEAAVIAYQRSEELLPDGVVGPLTARALGLSDPPPIENVSSSVTIEIVSRMFPVTPVRNIKTNLPFVLQALVDQGLTDKKMVLMALATIRAETEGFVPIDEGISRFNTSPGGRSYDLYDSRRDLGNQGPPDGATFRGRGFVQLTGRANYSLLGPRIGLGERLLTEPELANDPAIASKLLASFLKNKEMRIKQALLDGDFKTARAAVNGGSHGLEPFKDAYTRGDQLIAGGLVLSAGA